MGRGCECRSVFERKELCLCWSRSWNLDVRLDLGFGFGLGRLVAVVIVRPHIAGLAQPARLSMEHWKLIPKLTLSIQVVLYLTFQEVEWDHDSMPLSSSSPPLPNASAELESLAGVECP